jgi:hypothetical protein
MLIPENLTGLARDPMLLCSLIDDPQETGIPEGMMAGICTAVVDGAKSDAWRSSTTPSEGLGGLRGIHL